MTLRVKTLALMMATLIGLTAALYGVASLLLGRSFAHLEEEGVRQDVRRAAEAIDMTLDTLHTLALDWGSWDDLYDFAKTEDPEFIEVNLSDLSVVGIDVLAVINGEGEVAYSTEGDADHGALTTELLTLLHAEGLLFPTGLTVDVAGKDDGHAGLARLSGGLMLAAAQPILPSSGSGRSRGTLVVGRLLDDDERATLERVTHLTLRLIDVGDPALPAPVRALLRAAEPDQIIVTPMGEQRVDGATMLMDLAGRPAALLQVRLGRPIRVQGEAAEQMILGSILMVGAVFLVLTLGLLEAMVLSPLARLSAGVRAIGELADLSQRLPERGHDELGALARVINGMLGALASAREKEQAWLSQIQTERAEAERLLLNVLPRPIADRLRAGETDIADQFSEVTVLFADLVGFTQYASGRAPAEVLSVLNRIFSAFDALVTRQGLEKIKTIGDAYMAVAGLPVPRADHAEAAAELALQIVEALQHLSEELGYPFSVRVGLATGPVAAGVIGTQKFTYDLWGDTVNTASRMESQGLRGRIQVTEATANQLRAHYHLESRGVVQVRGKGAMQTWLLVSRRAPDAIGVALPEPGLLR